MISGSLGSVSSIPHVHDHGETTQHVWGGETEPNDQQDWRYWFRRAYLAWLARSEQLSLFEDWVA